ncbi:hypothetical protein PQI07_31335 [Methylobacterium sp. 092160098-2]|uniref:hypothetical protein n=1 Tax=Methylobacterium sp. 092160098-2 TaxID=3025129 RepID=UPI002381B83C|nr:hypothetical protein [Methylobacterium sp. 092160098-2]MDE4915126.1 hypothetical protein [Methylobacterium sp. 092160098-2]
MLIVVIDDPYDRFRYNRQAYEMPVGGGIHRISSLSAATSLRLSSASLRSTATLA